MQTHLSIGMLSRKGPFDPLSFGVTTPLPSGDFGGEQWSGWQQPVETLAIKDAKLDFCHVEPTGMFRGVVEDDASEQLPRRVDADYVLEAHAKVSIEVVENQMDVLRVSEVRYFGDRPATEAYVTRATDRISFKKAQADQKRAEESRRKVKLTRAWLLPFRHRH